jgi:hypothetical protein
MRFSGIDHRLDGERHARDDFQTFSCRPIVQDLGIFMEAAADSVSTVFANH